MPNTPDPQAAREAIRRALAEADGFAYENLEPHDYQRHADALLALLPAAVPSAAETTNRATSDAVREQLLAALDFAYCQGLGYDTPEALLAAYDATQSVPPPADRAALRDRIAALFRNPPGAARLGDATPGEIADAVLAVLPAQADQAERDALCREAGRLRKTSAEMVDRAERIEADVQQVRADRATLFREAADRLEERNPDRSADFSEGVDWALDELRAMADGPSRVAAEEQPAETPEVDLQVWPLHRVLSEVRCGSKNWTWEEEWADLDRRHTETGYLETLEAQIRETGITMPVLIGSDGRLWDGHHRLRIAVRLGIGYVPVEITPKATERPAVGEQPDTQTREARPPAHRWWIETLDNAADEWAPGTRYTDRTEALERYGIVSAHYPLWKDGTPVQRRFVRETTSYTVEDSAP